MAELSPFLFPGLTAKVNDLAVLHLKRDLQTPVILRASDELDEGYSEGKVTNTRFGSFPHSTLIGLPWGSQVRASAVDTGSRGRRPKEQQSANTHGQKRKRGEATGYADPDAITGDAREQTALKAAVTASTGFAHLLPPTPENWTTSLPHRTQVVYTPDYSYILQRLRVRPGTVVIEAGAGSGSFTHAAARAVFSGYPEQGKSSEAESTSTRKGKVWSFEFHEQRVEKLRAEIQKHGLDSIVEITHRDVCADGFSITQNGAQAVQADAIFLDLPAPWLALMHLTRYSASIPKAHSDSSTCEQPEPDSPKNPLLSLENPTPRALSPPEHTTSPQDSPRFTPSRTQSASQSHTSPLSPYLPVRICTFSPCIEQVQATHRALRSLSYTLIETVSLSAQRLEVRRERVGLAEEGLRGVNPSPATVDEAVGRLRDIETRTKAFHSSEDAKTNGQKGQADGKDKEETGSEVSSSVTPKQQRILELQERQAGRKLYREGRLVHRPEPELKTHTSYLTFAVLPREWTAEDEARAREKWKDGGAEAGKGRGLSRRKEKRAMKVAEGGGKGSGERKTQMTDREA
ncbi:tRNA (adenine-N(1)-)-methyltransferase catalytic subunit trm61 [Lambiella insularis]|nr:tRNA (adenine-N(1)-)-methyltransferase catalytic subunit trm61 [Lambiella insularis]